MSRKQLIDRWCVRCNRKGPTPFLFKHVSKLTAGSNKKTIVDIGCGNGRNLQYLRQCGFQDTHGFDMVDDYGTKLVFGKDPFPLKQRSADIILANYVFMFLNIAERRQIINEIKRIARLGCTIIVELYPAKDSHFTTDSACVELKFALIKQLGWSLIVNNKHKFIARLSV